MCTSPIKIVVYLLIPTSNHNFNESLLVNLLVVYLLIPTSNHNLLSHWSDCLSLYIFWFLHQTTTVNSVKSLVHLLYIFWFLHQTTTQFPSSIIQCSCISFDSYIKPQLNRFYITTIRSCISFDSYIKPQLAWRLSRTLWSCISFDSYIKPQRIVSRTWCSSVVYLLIPTSNHNLQYLSPLPCHVVYLLIPTSNHNRHDNILVRRKLYIFWFLHQTTTE